jgi:AcrR family transcriptional regulator
MDAIAEAAGLSKGSIYRYFPDKQGLFRDTILSAISESLDSYPSSYAPQPDLQLRRAWTVATDRRFASAYRLSLSQGRGSEIGAAASHLIEDRLAKPFAGYLRQTERDVPPSAEEALVISNLVVATLLGASLVGITTPESTAARVAFLLRACGLDAQSPQADGF